ncbi:MAG: pyridoxal phosphate-dependent aminotransferase [Methylotenera sp.]|uniref:MalY/PatB family protein n=1 Tax=Methylotenera sp. TaxID=2051956 RepID=UPI00272FF293|nr:pyridoxal phosphate-dependent aminotransferase [Methylotenera sp.]MDP2070069.1 pyridoxal phosphate-dependent aminotransferase [Methylotenera sp.]
MSFDFDQVIARSGTASVKHDGRTEYFGTSDVLPLWVADMDFAAPEAVTKALIQRAEHPVYGYSFYPESLYDSLIAWMKKRHDWTVQQDWIVMAPGVVTSLFATVMAFTEQGDGVIVQPPVYSPFFSAVTTNQRRLIENPLLLEDGVYRIDYEHLEHCAAEGAKLLLLCSPHNPVGRAWNKIELEQLLDISRRYDLTILSDEIHADLVYPGEQHTTLAMLANNNDKIITALAPSKTFNIPGLGLSALIASNPVQRVALKQVFNTLHLSNTNPFSIAAFEAAYRGGEAWLDELLIYLRNNRDFVSDYLIKYLPTIRLIQPQGTYLLWLDCRSLRMSDLQLCQFFVQQAKVGMNPGNSFGTGGSGFMRLNIASPRHVIAEALTRIANLPKTY